MNYVSKTKIHSRVSNVLQVSLDNDCRRNPGLYVLYYLQGILYRTGKDLYRWSRGKSRSFFQTLEFFSVLINELAFHGTNGSPIFPVIYHCEAKYFVRVTSLYKQFSRLFPQKLLFFFK
jgi:hypothetical protein